MTEKDLLDFTHKYREVRRFSPRRVYVKFDDWVLLMTAQHRLFAARKGIMSSEFTFDGARVIRMWSPSVCDAIRAWDLLPWSEP